METHILTDIKLSSDLLKQGELVGLPTETVYGLGANGLNPHAVAEIFRVKGRPQDNPLILHIASADWIERYCQNIPPAVWTLAEKFWPGPLTFVLEARDCVPEIVTAGLPTVGIRCPNHPMALAVIAQADLPIAAPSGNLSGKPSPTTAEAMFQDMNGKIPAILEGGACAVGVESTILAFSPKPCLLRAGGIGVDELEQVLGEKIYLPKEEEMETPLAPGMKYRHYAPQAPLTLVLGGNSATWIAEQLEPGDGVICFEEYAHLFPDHCVKILGKEKDFTCQAQQLFAVLRFFDTEPVSRIWAQCPREEGLGATVANRLQKASSYQIIDLERVGE